MNKKLICLISVLAITTLAVTGCGKKVVSVNGTAVSLDGVKIKSNEYYEIIKDAPTSVNAENIQKDNNNEDNESAN